MKTRTVLILVILVIISLGLFFRHSDVVSALDSEAIGQLYNNMQNISLALFGILLTVLALLASLVSHSFIDKMRKTGQFRVLMASIFVNALCFLCLIILTFIKPFLKLEQEVILLKINLNLLCISLVLLLDIGKKFWFVFCGLSQKS